jgi:hypothetical protein
MDAVREEGRGTSKEFLPHLRTSARIEALTADIQMYMISVTRREGIFETVTDATGKE